MANYIVQSGDSLSKIGSKLGVNWQAIANANGIGSPYTIYAGQSLVIPGSASPNGATNTGGGLVDTTNLIDKLIGGILLYGIFRVLMKVF